MTVSRAMNNPNDDIQMLSLFFFFLFLSKKK